MAQIATNVTSYGAKGDGTNDSMALQSAFDDIQEGRKLLFPKTSRHFMYDEHLVVDNKKHFEMEFVGGELYDNGKDILTSEHPTLKNVGIDFINCEITFTYVNPLFLNAEDYFRMDTEVKINFDNTKVGGRFINNSTLPLFDKLSKHGGTVIFKNGSEVTVHRVNNDATPVSNALIILNESSHMNLTIDNSDIKNEQIVISGGVAGNSNPVKLNFKNTDFSMPLIPSAQAIRVHPNNTPTTNAKIELVIMNNTSNLNGFADLESKASEFKKYKSNGGNLDILKKPK